MIISQQDSTEIIKQYQPNVVVTNDSILYDEDSHPKLIYVNYQELKTLLKYDNGYYISGVVMAVYSDDPVVAREEYQQVRKCIKKGNTVIHISKKDFCISNTSDKTISLDIDGKVIR